MMLVMCGFYVSWVPSSAQAALSRAAIVINQPVTRIFDVEIDSGVVQETRKLRAKLYRQSTERFLLIFKKMQDSNRASLREIHNDVGFGLACEHGKAIRNPWKDFRTIGLILHPSDNCILASCLMSYRQTTTCVGSMMEYCPVAQAAASHRSGTSTLRFFDAKASGGVDRSGFRHDSTNRSVHAYH